MFDETVTVLEFETPKVIKITGRRISERNGRLQYKTLFKGYKLSRIYVFIESNGMRIYVAQVKEGWFFGVKRIKVGKDLAGYYADVFIGW